MQQPGFKFEINWGIAGKLQASSIFRREQRKQPGTRESLGVSFLRQWNNAQRPSRVTSKWVGLCSVVLELLWSHEWRLYFAGRATTWRQEFRLANYSPPSEQWSDRYGVDKDIHNAVANGTFGQLLWGCLLRFRSHIRLAFQLNPTLSSISIEAKGVL
jgi:hypothetical protein